MASTIWQWTRIPAMLGTGLAAAASTLLYFKQNELIYPRNIPPGSRVEGGSPTPEHFGIKNYEFLRIPTPDGETLSAIFVRAPPKNASWNITVLMFHGNAGNISHRLPIAKVLAESIFVNVLMLEYRGYGFSTGTPDEKGLNVDAQAGLDWIRTNEYTKSHSIVIYGQSLGGAVAIQLCARNQRAGDIAGLILENTFLSIRKMVPYAFPPAKFLAPLCHQIWPSEETMPQVTEMPILFISGLKDEIVPPSHMKTLYTICRANTKIWKEIPNGDHNNSVAEKGYFDIVATFIHQQITKAM